MKALDPVLGAGLPRETMRNYKIPISSDAISADIWSESGSPAMRNSVGRYEGTGLAVVAKFGVNIVQLIGWDELVREAVSVNHRQDPVPAEPLASDVGTRALAPVVQVSLELMVAANRAQQDELAMVPDLKIPNPTQRIEFAEPDLDSFGAVCPDEVDEAILVRVIGRRRDLGLILWKQNGTHAAPWS